MKTNEIIKEFTTVYQKMGEIMDRLTRLTDSTTTGVELLNSRMNVIQEQIDLLRKVYTQEPDNGKIHD